MSRGPAARRVLRLARAWRRGGPIGYLALGLPALALGCRAPVTYWPAPTETGRVAATVAPAPPPSASGASGASSTDATATAEPPPSAGAPVGSAAATADSGGPEPYDSGAPGLPEPFDQDEQWGYRGSDGKVAIAPRFVTAWPFRPTGIAAVIDEQGWAYIDRRGQILVRPFLVDNGPDEFSDGLARFVHAGKIGYFDQAGAVVIDPSFDFGLPFEQGRARVCGGCTKEQDGEHWRVVGGRWWWIDRQGKEQGPAKPPDAQR